VERHVACIRRRNSARFAARPGKAGDLGGTDIHTSVRLVLMVGGLLAAWQAMAQKRGGILTVPFIDTPPSPRSRKKGRLRSCRI